MDKLINRERTNVISSERRMKERHKGDDTDSNQSRMNKLKGSVQRKLTGAINGINRKKFLLHGTTVILYLHLKGICSLNCKKWVSTA
jgi:hypothetical protein